MVFAVLLKKGQQVTPESPFAFPQIALAQTFRILEERTVKVELLGIKGEKSKPILSSAA